MKKTTRTSKSPAVVAVAAVAPVQRKAITKEFKLMAVQRMRQGDKSPTELALELGVRRNQLYKWAAALDQLGPEASFKGPGRLVATQESEVVKLRRELAKVSEELAILKKFDAYLTRKKQ